MNIQIFGTSKCFDTKKAQRYFKERGIRFQMAKPESSAMTIQVLTKVWVILKSPSRGILVWMVYRIFAPFSSIYSCSPPSSRGCTADASAGAGSSSTAMSTGSCGGVSGLYFPVIWR